MEIRFGAPSTRFLYDFTTDLNGIDDILGIIYLPGSSAGSPSFSPSFNSFWADTSIADRVVGRLGQKYGTAYQDKSLTTSTAQRRPVLFRQYVIPLYSLGLGAIRSYSPQSLGILYTKIYYNNAAATMFPICMSRIVDASGSALYPNPTVSGVTVPVHGGTTLVSSSGFSASDVGRTFYFNQLDNVVDASQAGLNQVQTFTNSSHVVMSRDYDSLSNTPGSGRTLIWNDNPAGNFIYGNFLSQATQAGSPGSQPTSPVAYAVGSTVIPGTQFWPHLYLVLEIGGIVINGGNSRTYNIRFGDPLNDTLATDTTNGSAAVVFTYRTYSRTIQLSR